MNCIHYQDFLPYHDPINLRHMIPQRYQYGDPLMSHDSKIIVEHISIRTKNHPGADVKGDY